MGSNTKAVASMMLVNLAMFAFVTANATYTPGTPCPTLDICVQIPLVGVTLGYQAGTPCCTLISGLVAANAQACICTGLVGSLLGSTLGGLLGLGPLVGGLLGTANLNKELAVLINACNIPNFTCPY